MIKKRKVMDKFIKIFLSGFLIFALCMLTVPAFGKNKVMTDVKVIHASTGQNYLDPGLKSIISELKTVFKYTSYRLLKEKKLNQSFNQKGRVNLPGKRTLVIVPLDTNGNRIRYQINILKNKKSVFQTRILLRNNSSITIGGPKFKNGYLLFNISGSVR
ncbi:MAG: hypothetical protein GY857_03935 [Desulfobacula sp.]|nr:hypothetical protein [Desulfobacula sp.]